MKIFLAITAALLLSEVYGAPPTRPHAAEITSEQLGNVVQQLQEMMLQSEMESKLSREQQYWPHQSKSQGLHPLELAGKQQRPLQTKTQGFGELQLQSYSRTQGRNDIKNAGELARSQQHEEASMQVQGVQIVSCGTAGDIINSALSVLNILFPTSEFGVLVNCAISPGCVQVRVDVPANNIFVDIDVCDKGNGDACVEVYVEPTTPCNGFGAIPIIVPIPIGGKQVSVDIRIIPKNNFFGAPGCATVKVDAPKC